MSIDFSSDLWINGRSIPASGGKRSILINPATEEPLGEVAAARTEDVSRAVEGAHEAFRKGWKQMKPGQRETILFRLAALIRQHHEKIALWESRNMGKPISDAKDEVLLGARTFEYYAGAIGKFGGQTIPVARGGLDLTLRQPFGVVAAIVPWNFPFPIACWKVAPALAAGNSVILKPASLSPLTALLLGHLATEAGVPDGVLQVLPGPGQVIGEALASHPLVRKISFTGSTEVGRQLMATGGPLLKRISLELGGKSPNIVFADSDWQKAAHESPMSVFANTGQDCCARSRVFVERKIFESFTELFLKAVTELKVGDPMDPATQIGPLVSSHQRDVAEGFLTEARASGAAVAVGGNRLKRKGFFLEPSVLLNVGPEDRCWKEEIFGPIVCLRPFDEEEAMLEEVNASPYGLSGSVWTNDLKRAFRVARAVESGVISINSHSSVHVEAPFGGFKDSGMGRDLGMAALENYTEIKNIYVADT